jgi:hypothetical protein
MGRPQKWSEPEDLPFVIQYSKLSGEKAWSNQNLIQSVISAVLRIVIVLNPFKIITYETNLHGINCHFFSI